jgi:hypothetical protein
MARCVLWKFAMPPIARLAAIAAILCAPACSTSSGTPPCNQDPWVCSAGQTCWPATETTFACLNSGAGAVGDVCDDTIGMATCGAGLACLQPPGAASGTCVAYCDNTDTSHACPSGQTCDAALLGGGTIQVCAGAGSSTEAGASPEASTEAGTVGATPDAATDGGVPPECAAWLASEEAQCGSTYDVSTLADCTEGESLYPPEGCGSEWESYVTCVTQATYSCASGPTGCDTQQDAYDACQSRFVSATSCDRLPDQDGKCAAATPYGFGCLSTVPSQCVELPPTGGVTVACCPAFAPM